MHIHPIALAALIAFSLPTIIVLILWIEDHARSHGLTFLGSWERWSSDGNADKTCCIFYIPIWRTRWNHSTMLID